MKKMWIAWFITVCLFSLCSCGTGTSDDESANTIASLERKIVELQDRITELEKENSDLRDSDRGNTVIDNKITDSDTNMGTSPIILEVDSAAAVGDIMDITITGAEWTDSILPPDTSKTYSVYGDKENETYFVVHGTITSYASDSFNIRWNSDSSFLINEKYTFSSTMEFVDSDGRGFGEAIKPLQTRSFIIYSSVSDEVYNICESVQVNFELPDNEEQIDYYYNDRHSYASFTITFSNME